MPDSIPVDLLNPGQVFACLGFMEAAESLFGGAQGGFDWSDMGNVRFLLSANNDGNPFDAVLQFLAACDVTSRSVSELYYSTSKWDVPTKQYGNTTAFPYPPPSSPATLTAVFTASTGPLEGRKIEVTHWGDSRGKSGRDNVKFWAGSGGYPGAALARDALDLVRGQLTRVAADPLNVSAEQSSSFRLDWRRDYIPLDIGFSLNTKGGLKFTSVGYPIVELLAAIGLTHSRPKYVNKLDYRYSVLGVSSASGLFSPFFLRASLGTKDLPFDSRHFRMQLGWPGKENQARCITSVSEV